MLPESSEIKCLDGRTLNSGLLDKILKFTGKKHLNMISIALCLDAIYCIYLFA